MSTPEPKASTGRYRRLELVGLGGTSGLLLFLSDYPVHAFPVQLGALVPLLLGLDRCARGAGDGLLGGICLGLAYTLPLLAVLEFPLGLGLPLAGYLTLLWGVAGVAVRRVRAWPGPFRALGTAAAIVLLEWVDYALVPVWGTAQTFVRVWSAAPGLVQLVSATGIAGVVFLVVAPQALAIDLVRGRERERWATLVVLAALAVLVGGASLLGWRETPRARWRVAAAGWTWRDLPQGQATGASVVLERVFRPFLERAAREGAALVAAPEVAFFVGGSERERLIAALSSLARRHRLAIVAGYFDVARRQNRVVWLDATGAVRGEYVKTHLIPFVERYEAGQGELVRVPTPVGLAGLMICQDDNFTDLSRAYARAGVALVVVPTNDWAAVQRFHYANSRFRALEGRYGLVRAASNGTSAIVSGRGEVLAERDHFRHGPGLVLADLPIYAPGVLYAAGGEWAVGAAAALLVLGGLVARRRRRGG